jgi:hypothetical protein
MKRTKKQIINFLLIVLWVEINSYILYYDCFHIGHHDVHNGLLILMILDSIAEFIVTPFSTILGNYDIKFGPQPIIFDTLRIFGILVSMIFYRLIFWGYKKWYYGEKIF